MLKEEHDINLSENQGKIFINAGDFKTNHTHWNLHSGQQIETSY